VTYTSSSDANEAIRKFDGANAAGITDQRRFNDQVSRLQ
jgi:hypothetical protein